MSFLGQATKSAVVNALGGPGSPLTMLVRAGLLGRPDAKNVVRSWRDRLLPGATPPPVVEEPVDPVVAERRRLTTLAKVEFSLGRIPTNFSINLGVAPCNHSCLFCPQSVSKPKRATWLDLEILRKVLHEIPEEGVHLNISSYSETLAAPNLVEAVRLMKEIRPKLPISMATNGSLFREKVVRGVIEAGLDYYQYSFDAPTRESYARLIQRDDFEKIIENLKRIIAIRDEINPKMVVTTHLMEFHETHEQNQDTMEMLRGLLDEHDMVSERRVANWGGGPWDLEKNLKTAGFTPMFEAPEKRYPCTSILMHFKLSPHGTYYPCVAAVPDHIEDQELHDVPIIGDAREITWTEAWQKMDEMRRAHLEGRWDEYECCKNCNIWGLWPNFWDDNDVTTPERPRFTIVGDVPHQGDGRLDH